MLSKCKGSTAGAICGAKWKDLSSVDAGWILCLQVTPQEAKQRLIFREQPQLMDHGLDSATDSNVVLAEAQQYSYQTGT